MQSTPRLSLLYSFYLLIRLQIQIEKKGRQLGGWGGGRCLAASNKQGMIPFKWESGAARNEQNNDFLR